MNYFLKSQTNSIFRNNKNKRPNNRVSMRGKLFEWVPVPGVRVSKLYDNDGGDDYDCARVSVSDQAPFYKQDLMFQAI